MNDGFLKKRKQELIELIKSKGITDEKVLEAIRKVPREAFVPTELIDEAYDDNPLPIGEDQTISQPYTVAFMTTLLDVKKSDKILEIGTGSGYQTAILAELGAEVYTIERIKTLYERATSVLKKLGYNNVKTFYADGYKGLPEYSPFDKIIITAAIPEIPDTLKNQLKTGGFIIAPVGSAYSWSGQIMTKLIKIDENNFEKKTYGLFVFVPMLKGLK